MVFWFPCHNIRCPTAHFQFYAKLQPTLSFESSRMIIWLLKKIGICILNLIRCFPKRTDLRYGQFAKASQQKSKAQLTRTSDVTSDVTIASKRRRFGVIMVLWPYNLSCRVCCWAWAYVITTPCSSWTCETCSEYEMIAKHTDKQSGSKQ